MRTRPGGGVRPDPAPEPRRREAGVTATEPARRAGQVLEPPPAAPIQAGRKRRSPTRPSPLLWLFVLPALLLYVVFFVGPTLFALQYSITDWDGISPSFGYVGTANYTELFTDDTIFRRALGNNLRFVLVVVVLQTVLSLLFAMLLVRNTRGSILLRALFFFPTILSSVSVAFVWSFVYDPNGGLLQEIGVPGPAQGWLGSEDTALYALAVTQVWFHTGQMLVVFVAGLQAIPAELYEAAELEGASGWQSFRHVTWPLVAPATAIVLAYTTIQSFKAFDLVFAMTQGGPNYSTEILATLIYNTAFVNFRFGYAAAESVVFMVLVGLVAWLQRRALRVEREA